MKPSILLQLDVDPQPSVFDGVVAVDAGVQHLFRHGGITPIVVRDLVHGTIFTRGGTDLQRTAIFVGGSNVAAAESVLKAVQSSFFGPFRTSVLFDANGCNTTAAAAVLAAIEGLTSVKGSLSGARVAVLAATGPVGQRVARLLLRQDPTLEVRVGSRHLEKAQSTAQLLEQTTGRLPIPFGTASEPELRQALDGVDAVVAAGAAGVTLLPAAVRSTAGVRVLIDLNAVPPLGIEGVEATDKAKNRDGVLCWGALGVGGPKMKIHRKAIQALFETNLALIDAEECLEIGKGL